MSASYLFNLARYPRAESVSSRFGFGALVTFGVVIFGVVGELSGNKLLAVCSNLSLACLGDSSYLLLISAGFAIDCVLAFLASFSALALRKRNLDSCAAVVRPDLTSRYLGPLDVTVIVGRTESDLPGELIPFLSGTELVPVFSGTELVGFENGLLASRLDGRSLQSMNSFFGVGATGVLAGEEVGVEGVEGLFTGPILASPLIR